MVSRYARAQRCNQITSYVAALTPVRPQNHEFLVELHHDHIDTTVIAQAIRIIILVDVYTMNPFLWI